MDSHRPNKYWENRYTKYGHTGWNDHLVYAYDQPLRLHAILKTIGKTGIRLDGCARILDAGCGTGDLVREFAQEGASEVIGVDISRRALRCAKQRLCSFETVDLVAGRIQQLAFRTNCFNLVTSITVLQHVVEWKSFSLAVANMIAFTRLNGHILLLESCSANGRSQSSSYRLTRSRRQLVASFERRGCSLVFEASFPQLGVYILTHRSKIVGLIVRRASLLRDFTLSITRLFDRLDLPLPHKSADLKIMVFKKTRDPGTPIHGPEHSMNDLKET